MRYLILWGIPTGAVIARTAMNYSELIAGLISVATTGASKLRGPRWYNRLVVALLRFLLEAMASRWQELIMPILIVRGAGID